jgi:hypothetical protein
MRMASSVIIAIIALLCVAYVIVVEARPHAVMAREIAQAETTLLHTNGGALPYHQTTYWFKNQKLDHFDPTNTNVRPFSLSSSLSVFL